MKRATGQLAVLAWVTATWFGAACSCGPKETLLFTTSPESFSAGSAQPAITVAAQQQGQTDKGASGKITLKLMTADGGPGTFGGTPTQSLVNGVATFGDIVIAQAGTLVMVADGPNFIEGTSSPFVISIGALSRIAFANLPTAAQAGEPFNPPVEVRFEDTFGNVVPNGDVVTVTLAGGTSGAQLLGGNQAQAVNGVATFSGLLIDKIGTGYTLTATTTTTGIASVTSAPFDVGIGPPRLLSFQTQPSNTGAGAAIAPAIQVRVTDAVGDLITNSAVPVTLGIGVNPGNGTLFGTVTQNAAAGVATFNDISLHKTGVGYRLIASATNVQTETSDAFTISAGAPIQLGFVTAPGTQVIQGAPIRPTVQVAMEDSFNNVVGSGTATVTMSLAQSQTASANLAGTKTIAATAGVASFADLNVTANGSNYTLTASAPAFASITSPPFTCVTRSITYVDPTPGTGKIQLVRNPSSTFYSTILDAKTQVALTGYSVGFNLPLDATKVTLNPAGITLPGAPPLSPGNNPAAMLAVLPTRGPLNGVVVAGISQKAAGNGAVALDQTIPAGTTLFSVTLDLLGTTSTGVVFDGTATGNLTTDPRFNAQMRDKVGNLVAGPADFRFGKLTVQ